MYELECTFQNYEWGKLGNESTVASLLKANNAEVQINDNQPYAELWMGTHVNGPSKLKETKENLMEFIQKNVNVLGAGVIESFGKQLPFLLKVLSINKALSIQAHPDKKLAEELHSKRPDLYKDANHKPELAIALTEFQGLSGFRPLNDIKDNIKKIPELRVVIGDKQCDALLNSTENNYENALKECFKSLMICPNDIIQKQLNILLERVKDFKDVCSRKNCSVGVLEQVAANYPGDVGCFAVYFLNYIILSPGEAMYLGPNVPHAYLKGDCVECMASSDNVVRVGLTPKYKDIDTLCSMLEYKCEPSTSRYFKPIGEDKYTELFKPPVPDFAVAKIQISEKMEHYKLIKRSSASIIIVTAGVGKTTKGISLESGKIFFLSADEEISITVNNNLQMFQAFTNI